MQGAVSGYIVAGESKGEDEKRGEGWRAARSPRWRATVMGRDGGQRRWRAAWAEPPANDRRINLLHAPKRGDTMHVQQPSHILILCLSPLDRPIIARRPEFCSLGCAGKGVLRALIDALTMQGEQAVNSRTGIRPTTLEPSHSLLVELAAESG